MRLSGLNIQATFKGILPLVSSLCLQIITETCMAGGGLFFNVLAAGNADNVNITLCLNGRGPLSCQIYTVSALNLNISTTIPNHVYSSAGIKVNSPGYSLTGCTPISNGYCLFSVSNTASSSIQLHNDHSGLVASVTSLTLSVNCPPLMAGCAHTNVALTGNSRQITITNNGSNVATNISVAASGLPSGTSITTNTCQGVLGVNQSCLLTISPGASESSNCSTGIAPTNGTITVTADDFTETKVSVLVLTYGCIYQGGYVYSVDDATPNTGSIGGKVAAPIDQASPNLPGVLWSADSSGNYDGGVSLWGIDDTSTFSSPSPNAGSPDPAILYPGQTNCNGASDGSCNTNNIYVYYSTVAVSIPPLTKYATGLCKASINGYSDWYLPSICEMGPDSGGLVCSAPPLIQLEQNMVDGLPVLTDNCIGPMCLAGDYWSSTELSGNPVDIAWTECFASNGGSTQCVNNKDDFLGVRCSRALTF